MASSFGAATIVVLRDDGTAHLPRWSKRRHVARHPVPGGTDHVTQLLGADRASVTWRLWLTEAEYAALEALAQTSATLTLAGASQGTCTLLSLDGEEWDATGANVFVSATFERAT